MSRFARILFYSLLTAVILAGVAAIALIWEDEERPEYTQSLEGVGKFVPRSDRAQVPNISFVDGDGSHRTLAEFRGQIVVVNFWATWCAPCVRELPSLDRLQKRLKRKDVTVIALSLDRGGAQAVREFYDEVGIHNLEVYVDPSMDAQQAFAIPGLPTTVLIDREGRDRGRLVGPADWDTKEAKTLVLSADE